ncbi:MAG: OsmC family protein [Gammaproteobacteria bacterium]
MHRYTARIEWQRDDGDFARGRYSRVHRWLFDGGISVAASASPQVVPLPFSSREAVDPEEALVAAASSCHMLTFVHLASKQGFVVERYADDAEGFMEKNARGKYAITRIVLHPAIVFGGERAPDRAQLDALHHAAHEECYIANSIVAEVEVVASGREGSDG